jgi:hypothetical protein
MAAYSDASHIKARLGGIADATIEIKFVVRPPGPKAPEGTADKTILRTRLVSHNDDAILFARSAIQPKSMTITTLKNGSTRAVAEYTDKSQISLLRVVAKYGIVHSHAAAIAFDALKRGDLPETFRAEVEEALSKVSETRIETHEAPLKRKKDAPPPAEGEPTTKTVETVLPIDDDVMDIVSQIREKSNWLPAFVEGGAVIKNATENDDGKRKMGNLVVSTRKMPGGLAVAHALNRAIGAGCTKSKRARIAFTTKRNLKTLRDTVGSSTDTIDFDDIIV